MRARQLREERPNEERARFPLSGACSFAAVLKTVRDGLMASAYPEQCRVCGNAIESYDDGVACEDCWLDSTITRMLDSPVCDKCGSQMGAPVGGSPAGGSPAGGHARRKELCGMCAAFPFSAARSSGIYSGALEANIIFLKSYPHVCRRLREMIFRTFQEHQAELASDVVIPVPLYRARARERGFNQAGIIAKLIARRFHLRLDDRSLIRSRPTEMHRAGLDRVDRQKSVERAFTVARPKLVEGQSVLLVDDLFTTGSTLSAASKALIEAGASRVSVLTIARVEDRARLRHHN